MIEIIVRRLRRHFQFIHQFLPVLDERCAIFTVIAQTRAPAEIRGRVLAVFTVILGSLYPLGSIVQGKVADHIGLRATTAGSAVLILLTLLATRVLRPGITAAIDSPVD